MRETLSPQDLLKHLQLEKGHEGEIIILTDVGRSYQHGY